MEPAADEVAFDRELDAAFVLDLLLAQIFIRGVGVRGPQMVQSFP